MLPYSVNFDGLVDQVIQQFVSRDKLFNLEDHFQEYPPAENQSVTLIKKITEHFFHIRLHHAAKIYTQNHKKKLRLSRHQKGRVIVNQGD